MERHGSRVGQPCNSATAPRPLKLDLIPPLQSSTTGGHPHVRGSLFLPRPCLPGRRLSLSQTWPWTAYRTAVDSDLDLDLDLDLDSDPDLI